MIRVQFLESIGGRDFNYGRGGYYTLPASEAEYYIRVGLAEKVKEEEKEVRPLRKKVQKRPVK
ncbi:MAG: hypothetical protein ACTSRU_18440 [Candidatus Hodarchaeales archaeon]